MLDIVKVFFMHSMMQRRRCPAVLSIGCLQDPSRVDASSLQPDGAVVSISGRVASSCSKAHSFSPSSDAAPHSAAETEPVAHESTDGEHAGLLQAEQVPATEQSFRAASEQLQPPADAPTLSNLQANIDRSPSGAARWTKGGEAKMQVERIGDIAATPSQRSHRAPGQPQATIADMDSRTEPCHSNPTALQSPESAAKVLLQGLAQPKTGQSAAREPAEQQVESHAVRADFQSSDGEEKLAASGSPALPETKEAEQNSAGSVMEVLLDARKMATQEANHMDELSATAVHVGPAACTSAC